MLPRVSLCLMHLPKLEAGRVREALLVLPVSLLWLGVITGSGPGAATTRVWVTLTAWDTPILQVYCPVDRVNIEYRVDIVDSVSSLDSADSVEGVDNIDSVYSVNSVDSVDRKYK